jgi:putative ABC transport system permease protein
MILARTAMLSLRMLLRSRVRASLAVAGIAVAVFILCAERAVHSGVSEATAANARDTRLVVYRANRFCPFTSHLPERYADEVASMPGVRSAVPMQIVVSSCYASLDVVVFRGVPLADAERTIASRLRFVEGTLADFLARDDAALVGSGLAARRGLSVGDRLQAAGITVTIAAIVDADGPQDRNSCLVHLPFLQAASGGVQGGTVTQLEVEVDDPAKLREVASAIDAYFATDRAPTTTRPEKAFVARAAADLVAIADFAGFLGIGALLAIFALVANAIVLSLEHRARELAMLQSIGFTGKVLAWGVVVESSALALVGGVLGAGAATLVLALGRFSLGAEGVLVEFRPSATIALASVALALVVGVAAGLVPAISAARRTIIEGLRST